MKKLMVIVSALTLSLNVFAAEKKAKKKAEAAAVTATEVYKLDLATSSIEWKGFKKVGSSHNGDIKFAAGQINVENSTIKSGEFTVDMKTITNKDITDATYNKKLVTHLSSEDFFNVTKTPTSSFKLTSFTAGKNAGEYTVKGELTMIGATHPVEFPATVKFENGVATGSATLKLDRTKWGLKYGSGNFFKELAADKIISDEFELNLKLTAKK